MADLLQPATSHPMLVAVLAVVIIAPFEYALFTLPGGMTVTSVEVVTLVALTMLIGGRLRARETWAVHVPRGVLAAGAAFLLTLVIAALWTSFAQANALRFVARMAVAAALFAGTLGVIDSPARARLVAAVMLAVATLVAIIAVLEALQVSAVMAMLTRFRPGFHVVAGQLRATSTLVYPTIASMYLEVAFAVGLALLLQPTRRRHHQALVFVALVVIGAGISATFTRAGLLAMAAAIATVAMVRAGSGRPDLGVLSGLAISVIAVVFVAHSPELLAARATTEGSGAWYGARYEVPATLTMRTAGVHRVPVTVTNTGRLTWDSSKDPAFALSYHWVRPNDDAVVIFEGQRSTFRTPVRPGESASFEADVIAPGEPGTYTLVWDVVHETRAWLSTEGVAPARSNVRVSGDRATPITTTMTHLPRATVRPARPALWSAALQMAAQHPVLGVGPDNYRLASGRYLGTDQWDARVHANNMYLEALTGAGVPGLATLLWLVVATGAVLWRRVRHAGADTHVGTAAALAVWIVIAGHGLVDSFLSFTTTYVTFAVAAAWALSPGLVQGARNAHRV